MELGWISWADKRGTPTVEDGPAAARGARRSGPCLSDGVPRLSAQPRNSAHVAGLGGAVDRQRAEPVPANGIGSVRFALEALERCYRPPSVTTFDQGPQPKALCALTLTPQSGTQSTVKLAPSVVPETVCV